MSGHPTSSQSHPTSSVLVEDDDFLLDQLLEEDGFAGEAVQPVVPRRAPSASVPLSFGQELLWLLDCASPGMTAYKVLFARRLRGRLDVAALEKSLTQVAARHEALRTRFAAAAGGAVQIVDEPVSVGANLVELSAVPPAAREARAAEILTERAHLPFDLARGHLLRATLVRLGSCEHILLLETHHIVVDGGSLGVLLGELSLCYAEFARGSVPALPPPPLQFGDYALWQRERFSGDHLEELLGYWRAELGAALEPLGLPTDYPRATTPTFAGARASLQLEPELLAAVQDLGRQHGATLFMTLLAAYAAVLHRYTGRPNILVGSGAAPQAGNETAEAIGYFADMLVQRADLSGDPTFEELLLRVRTSCLGAYEHQGVPLELLIAGLRGERAQLGATSLFDVVLTPQDGGGSSFTLAGLEVEPYALEFAATKFDMALLPGENARGLRLTLLYRAELFAPATALRLLAHLQLVLEAAVADATQRVSRISLLTEPERALLAATNATAVAFGPGGVREAFEMQARRVPQSVALVCGDEQLTYAALNGRANRIARRLRAGGAGPGTLVGLGMERGLDTVAGLLGILKAGAAYVPLATGGPPARLQAQIRTADVRFVLAPESAAAEGMWPPPGLVVLPVDSRAALEAVDALNPGSEATAEDLAYVLFTSGSTGEPKGVAVTHGNLWNYTAALSRVLAASPPALEGDGLAALDGWHFGMVSTLAADLGNSALFPALCAGGTLHLIPAEVATDPVRYAAYVAAQPLDVLKITPGHFRALLGGTGEPAPLPRRWLILGGEACPWALVDDLLQMPPAGGERCRILNHYGPTETTVGAAVFEASALTGARAREAGARTVPIGSPLANVRLHVLDARFEPVAQGLPGELFIAGEGVARGYFGRPDLTANAFLDLPAVGRVYRSGDRVRRLPSGDLEFLGRIDTQVKVRGFRVELGEIEAALSAHPAVAQVAVCLREGAAGVEPRLVAFVATRAPGDGTLAALQALVAAGLPDYMRPASYVFADALPLTPNGKIDRQALPAEAASPAASTGAPPRTATERALLGLWAEAFKRPAESLGVRDDFLALGGHSLLAIRILGKISRTFEVRLSLRTLFEAPTIESLARAIEAGKQATAAVPRIGRTARAAYAIEVPAAALVTGDRPAGGALQ